MRSGLAFREGSFSSAEQASLSTSSHPPIMEYPGAHLTSAFAF